MFQRGDQVLYGIHGVCKIVDIESKRLDGKVTEYYVLEPMDQASSKYYIPTQNKAAVAKLRPILMRQELLDLLRSDNVRDNAWTDDENQRKQLYRSLITSGDRAALVRMVHTLHKHKAQQAAMGRRLHLCDENFLRDAQNLLNAEFSLVLNINHDEVGDYVQSILDTQ